MAKSGGGLEYGTVPIYPCVWRAIRWDMRLGKAPVIASDGAAFSVLELA